MCRAVRLKFRKHGEKKKGYRQADRLKVGSFVLLFVLTHLPEKVKNYIMLCLLFTGGGRGGVGTRVLPRTWTTLTAGRMSS